MTDPRANRRPPLTVDGLVELLAAANEPEVGYSGVRTEYEHGRLRSRWRVWHYKNLARVEDPPGRLSLLAGQSSYWRSWPIDDGLVRLPRTPDVLFNYELSTLAMIDPVDYWSDWLTSDPRLVVDSLREGDHDGRRAWKFSAPPPKGSPVTLTVDAELGVIVRSETPDEGVYLEWSELRTEPALDDADFEQPTADDLAHCP